MAKFVQISRFLTQEKTWTHNKKKSAYKVYLPWYLPFTIMYANVLTLNIWNLIFEPEQAKSNFSIRDIIWSMAKEKSGILKKGGNIYDMLFIVWAVMLSWYISHLYIS